MKLWLATCLQLVWAAYLVLTSFYCLLTFLPYTYYALIKAPPYAWMPWFVHHHVHLYWVTLLGVVGACWQRGQLRRCAAVFAALILGGIFFTAHPLLPGLQSDFQAYAWGVAALAPVVVLSALDVLSSWPDGRGEPRYAMAYSAFVFAAIAVALLTIAGTGIRNHLEARPAAGLPGDFALGVWTVITHAVLAILTVSLLNLVFVAVARTPYPRLLRYSVLALGLFLALTAGLTRFLESALSFQGWPANTYAATLAGAAVLLGLSLVLAVRRQGALPKTAERRARPLAVCVIVGLGVLALFVPAAVGEWDWNGIFQSAFAVLLWVALSSSFCALQRRRAHYSAPALAAILLVTGFSYKALQATEIFWSRPLGTTDGEVSRQLENYASQNASFQLAHYLLGNAPGREPCGDLCRILRQYTNVRDARTTAQINLVDPLLPASGARPNIFILVIDSMRPDFLGAYNPKVDFTPNIDAFARDSVVFRNAYTQYAGTTLSEPAIWSGAMLLHAHYVRPFARLNSLEKLLNADGYRMVVSFDTVLKELLSPRDDLVKLDTDKPWNQFELCSTVEQLDSVLKARSDLTRPVFFYAQPMNVHMFAHNHNPTWRTTSWRRPGFNLRIALDVHQVDECMGKFFAALKAQGLYDDSIIILASDHGDATGEFGRQTHSYIIYPEVMHVPLIIHLPQSMQHTFVYDQDRVSTLTDITPSLYYLLGHRPVKQDPMFGHPLFAETRKELDAYHRDELFLASDEVAVYGLLKNNGRYLYATYDSPARSFLFDLARDPNAEHSILTDELKWQNDERVIDYLKMIADFYGYKPGIKSLLASTR